VEEKQLGPGLISYSIRCDDPLDMCCNGKIPAYTLEHSAKVNFCPRFYTLPTLQGAMDLVAGNPSWAGYVQGYMNRRKTLKITCREKLHRNARKVAD